MKQIFIRSILFLTLALLTLSISQAQVEVQTETETHQGLRIYYIRHAEGGHNVKKQWEEKGIPKADWPSYVGNPDEFTPRGIKEVVAATEKLQKYKFDLVAASPLWRTRNTILPYLKKNKLTAEVWPELREGPGMSSILSKDIPEVKEVILNAGKPIELPDEELGFFTLREEATNNYAKYPKDSKENEKVAYMKHVNLHAIKLIEERFGSDESILLVGHNSSGVSLLKLLLKKDPKSKRGLNSTGMWMVEQREDGTFQLKIYNDEEIAEED